MTATNSKEQADAESRRPRRSAATPESSPWPGQRRDEHQEVGHPVEAAGWVKFEDGASTVVRVVDVGADFRDGFVHHVEFTRKGAQLVHARCHVP